MPTLIVVDMQEQFSAANSPHVIKGVRHEIKEARKEKNDIMFLEFEHCGPTKRKILDGIAFYPQKKHQRVVKEDDNGAYEAVRAMKEGGFDLNKIRVCGVNSDACVQRTVNGLTEKLSKSKITVALDACGCEANRTTSEIKGLMVRPNVSFTGEHKK